MKAAILAALRMWQHTGHQVYDFGTVTGEEAQKILQDTGVNISGYRQFMATRGVRHVKNNHSDAVREAEQRQYSVTPQDFCLIPKIALQGVPRLIGTTGARKPARLEHRATIDGRTYVYIETVGANDKRLELWTMRIEQQNKGNV